MTPDPPARFPTSCFEPVWWIVVGGFQVSGNVGVCAARTVHGGVSFFTVIIQKRKELAF